MAKKIFALIVTVCVLGAFIGGCGSKDDTSGTSTGSTGSTGTTTGGTTTGK